MLTRILSNPYILLIIGPSFWGGNFVVARWVQAGGGAGEIGPVELAAWRWSIAGLILLPLAGRALWQQRAVWQPQWPWVLALSVSSIGLFNTMVYIGLQTTSAINGTVLNVAISVFVLMILVIVLRERVAARSLIAIGLGTTGVLIVVTGGSLARLLELRFTTGDLWIIAGMFSYATYSVLLRKRPAISALAFLGAIVWFSLPLLWLLAAFEGIQTSPLSWSGPLWTALMYFAVFPSIISALCWNRGVELIGPERAGIFIVVTPVAGAIAAILFLDEPLRLYHLVSLLFVTGAILLTRQKRA